MPFIIALVLMVVVAMILFSVAIHILFSPWLLLIAVAAVAWIKLRPRRTPR